MPGPDKKTSLRLSGGVDNRSQSEFIEPVPVQGGEPKLARSVNTRLSKVRGGVARSPLVSLVSTLSTRAWGFFSSAAGRVTRLGTGGSDASGLDISGDGSVVGLRASGAQTVTGRIVRSQDLDGADIASGVASSYNSTTGTVWRAYLTDQAYRALFVSAEDASGNQMIASTYVLAPSITGTTSYWVGLTSHGSSGTFVWFYRSTGLTAYKLSRSGMTFIPAAATTIALPGQLTVAPDIVASGQYAYVVFPAVGSVTDATVLKIDVTTMSTAATATIVASLNSGGACAIDIETINGTEYVAVGVSRFSDRTSKCVLMSNSLSTVGSATVNGAGPSAWGRVGNATWAYAVSNFVDDFSSNPAGVAGEPRTTPLGANATIVWAFNVPAWTQPALSGYALPFTHLHSKGASWRVDGASDSSRVWLLPMVRRYGITASKVLPGGSDYVDDPAIVVYALESSYGYTPQAVARIACVRGGVAPALTFGAAFDGIASRSDRLLGDVLEVGWRKLGNRQNVQGVGRVTSIDLSPAAIRSVTDKEGAAHFTGAMPKIFDGWLTRTAGWNWAPRLSIAQTAFGSTPLPNGTYRAVLVCRWSDASGIVWRSRVSNLATFTVTGAGNANVYPYWAADEHGLIGVAFASAFVDLYVSDTNGSVPRYVATTVPLTSAAAVSFAATLPTANAPQVYSTGSAGEELPPQPAPPLRDIAAVGARLVGIDAEFPTRIPYTKLRVAGVGYEWHPALEIALPSEAGDAVAVREWAGLITIFAERGVYQVSGDGPDNTGTGSYAQPLKISEIGCSRTDSVIAYPGGIMWQSGGRFARMTGAGIGYDEDFACTSDVSTAVCMPRFQEVLFFSASVAEARVFNYAVGRWTTWDSSTIPAPVSMATLPVWDQDTLYLYSASSNTVRKLTANSISTTATSMTFETDWFLLDAEFQSHIILRDVVFSGVIAGPHDIEVAVFADYAAAPQSVMTWTYATLSANAVNGRYTVRYEPPTQNGRAFKVRVKDTLVSSSTTGGMIPVAVTLVWARDDGSLYEEIFNAQTHR